MIFNLIAHNAGNYRYIYIASPTGTLYRFTMLTRNLSRSRRKYTTFINITYIYAIFFLLTCINFDSII